MDGIGALGTVQHERKLTYYEVNLSGHMYVTAVVALPPGRDSLTDYVTFQDSAVQPLGKCMCSFHSCDLR